MAGRFNPTGSLFRRSWRAPWKSSLGRRFGSTNLGAKVRVNGSGRTDAGVHALGQVANFSYGGDTDLRRLQKGLNALSPHDIVVKQVELVPDSFDARRDARSRVYQYRIWNHPVPSAFYRGFSRSEE